MSETIKCEYDLWFDGKGNQNRFTVALFDAYTFADGTNRRRIREAFPELFKDSINV